MQRVGRNESGPGYSYVACLAVLAAVQACSSSNEDLFHKGGASGITGTGGKSGFAGSGASEGGGSEPSGGDSASAGAPGSMGGSAGSPEPRGGATSSAGSNSGQAGSSGGSSSGSSGSSSGGTVAGGGQSRGGTPGVPAMGGGTSSASSGGVSSAGAGGSGDENMEVCDALDNDANGVIDDLDAGGDGVCDCLRIATLGFPGTWGTGSFISNWLQPLAPHARIDSLKGEVLTPESLAGYDVIFALNVSPNEIDRSYTADEARALAAWVKDGGGLMTLIGFSDATEVANVNLLLAGFDLHYESSQIFIRSATLSIPVTEFAAHPITVGVTAVGMDNGYEPRGTGTVYAKKNQVNIGIAQEFGKGHVDVWGDEWITYVNQWKDRANYDVPRFWLNTIQWLTPSGVCKVPMPSTFP
jgi:hypothetical protein